MKIKDMTKFEMFIGGIAVIGLIIGLVAFNKYLQSQENPCDFYKYASIAQMPAMCVGQYIK